MFLSEKHNGLDILIDYLSTTQFIMRYQMYYYYELNRFDMLFCI